MKKRLLKAAEILMGAVIKIVDGDRVRSAALNRTLEEYLTLRTASYAALKVLERKVLTNTEEMVKLKLILALEDPIKKG